MSEDYVYNDTFRENIYDLVPSDGKVIGTIGCGYAPTEARLVAEGREVHGADISPHALEVAGKRLTSVRLIQPGNTMPFEAESLDGLILADVLEHIPEAWNALADFAKMIKPGGWIAISVPNMRYIDGLWTFLVKGEWPEHDVGLFDRTHIHVMTHKRLDRWAAQAGLVLDMRRTSRDWRWGRRQAHRVIDAVTFRLFHNFLDVGIEARYRKPARA